MCLSNHDQRRRLQVLVGLVNDLNGNRIALCKIDARKENAEGDDAGAGLAGAEQVQREVIHWVSLFIKRRWKGTFDRPGNCIARVCYQTSTRLGRYCV